ncbi:PDZ domain-containing protein [Lutibacter aestuarii]|uniref:PDZ domain-containing protein n=1 Tax=Lutibacter aestuarii TaxID=861111 RepID=A0ABW2ZCD7_9FLAO|nr:alpha/beta hydrolase [uncultured Lutibacter sp.]
MKLLKTILVVIAFTLVQTSVESQTLKRKGMLGIMMQNLTDSIASQNKLTIKNGVYINTVMPNSTFSNLGIKQGDVLTKLNGISVNTIQDVLTITSELFEGDSIEAEFYSKNKKQLKKTELLGRPIEKFNNGNVFYGEVAYKDNLLRSILVTPKNIKNPPVVYFLQGYTCGSVETASDHNPSKKLFNDWVNAGFAVFRVEKPGVGDSKCKVNCLEIGFTEELQAFKEGYKYLLQQQSIDSTNIFLFGHSMGGVIAPLLNKYYRPKGIITYGTVAKSWYDYMVDLYTIQPKHFGTSDAEIKENNKVNLKFNNDLLINKLSGEEMLKNKDYAEFFNVNDFKRNQYIGRHFKFWQSLADINIPKAWTKVKTNVLALHGEFDIQAINSDGAQELINIVNKNGGNGTFILVKNADHGFINFNSMQHNVETLGNGTYMNYARDNFNKKIGEESINWMKSIIK